VTTTPDEAIGEQFGLYADDFNNLAAVAAALATLLEFFVADNSTRSTLIDSLYLDPGLPSDGFNLGGANNDEVSVLRAPLEPVILVPQGAAICASLCGLLATALTALGEPVDGAVLAALSLRQAQGPALQGGPGFNNPYPGNS